jgi:D-glycero-alpha-D-manno-heptose 1-phosphate guanylyltransferase
MECIVLAGGLGTRLQSVVDNVPKCMAPVNGKPFLHYVFDYLEQEGIKRVILSLGYKHEYVIDWVQTQQRSFTIDHVIEHEPLGTGGGIQLAMGEASDEHIFVLNGDTMFSVDMLRMLSFHQEKNAATTLALKSMKRFDRYGVVNTNEEDCITSFEEKQYKDLGLINGGVYLINIEQFLQKKMPVKFSFEKDYLEALVHQRRFFGYKCEGYFIDIGIPADYNKAQEDFKTI